jgi:hypothetical protein
VEVYVYGFKPAVRPKITRPKGIGTTQFKIRMIVGTSAGLPKAVVDALQKLAAIKSTLGSFIPATADVLLFEIAEDNPPPAKNKSATFLYLGGGAGLSASLPKTPKKAPGVSVSLSGPFTRFRTSRPVVLPTFSGEASAGQPPQITIGPVSKNSIVQLTMESGNLVNARAVVSPRHLKISTGPGFSITLFSITKGVLTMLTAPTDFSGP